MRSINEEILDEVTGEVWDIDPFQLFRDLVDKGIWEGGTVKAEDMFDEKFLLKPRCALVAFLYEERTGEVLQWQEVKN